MTLPIKGRGMGRLAGPLDLSPPLVGGSAVQRKSKSRRGEPPARGAGRDQRRDPFGQHEHHERPNQEQNR